MPRPLRVNKTKEPPRLFEQNGTRRKCNVACYGNCAIVKVTVFVDT